jgi:hypothetical protein
MKSAEVAENTLINTQRAFAHLQEIKTETVFRDNIFDGTKEIIGWRVILQWHNTGHTPALNVKSTSGSRHFQRGQELSLSLLPTDSGELPGITLGPNTGMHSVPINFTIGTVRKIESGEVVALVLGLLEYNDVFKGTPMRRTAVCVKLTTTGEDLAQTRRPFEYTAEGPKNYAD